MAAAPTIKEADSDEEAPTERIAGVKKILEGRMQKLTKKEEEANDARSKIETNFKPIKQWNQVKLHEDNIMVLKP